MLTVTMGWEKTWLDRLRFWVVERLLNGRGYLANVEIVMGDDHVHIRGAQGDVPAPG